MFVYPYVCTDAIIITNEKEKKREWVGRKRVDMRRVKINGVDGLI